MVSAKERDKDVSQSPPRAPRRLSAAGAATVAHSNEVRVSASALSLQGITSVVTAAPHLVNAAVGSGVDTVPEDMDGELEDDEDDGSLFLPDRVGDEDSLSLLARGGPAGSHNASVINLSAALPPGTVTPRKIAKDAASNKVGCRTCFNGVRL